MNKQNSIPSFYCKNCSLKLSEEVKICPKCGCNNKIVKMTVCGELIFRGTFKALKFILDKKDWVKEVLSGWFPSVNKTKHPEGVEKERVINRERYKEDNSYQEKTKDVKTGIITRDFKEPLIKHRHK